MTILIGNRFAKVRMCKSLTRSFDRNQIKEIPLGIIYLKMERTNSCN